ncbi:MAG: NOL1/NOP2/sun family putative RNA methylase [Candidatus Woesearchaeota archaeon]|jgi:NOL1/NOP2/sun family putative RNA methylase
MRKEFLKRYEKWGYPQQTTTTLPRVVRVNTLVATKATVLKNSDMKLKAISFLPNGFVATSKNNIVSSPAYLYGQIYVQEAASQLPALVLNPKKTDSVLDMCAAPGSKTTQLAALMENEGTLIALDLRAKRLEKLCFNLERCGVQNTTVIKKDAEYIEDFDVLFDKILLDAPCSGNFAADANWFEKRQLSDVKTNTETQKKLIEAAIEVLKPGGVLVYSTCSLEIEENEEIVEYALEKFPVSLQKIDISIGATGLTEKTKLCKRLWPTQHKTQGFFIAKFVKE